MSEDPKKLGVKEETGIGENPSESLELTKEDRLVLNKLKEIDPNVESHHATISVFSDERFKSGYEETKEQISNRIEKFERMGLIMKLKPNHYYCKDEFVGYYHDGVTNYYILKEDNITEKRIMSFGRNKEEDEPLDIIDYIPHFFDKLSIARYPIGLVICNVMMFNDLKPRRDSIKELLIKYLIENKEKYGLCIADRNIGNLRRGDLCSKSYYNSLITENSGADAGDQNKGVGGFLEAQSGEDGVKPIVEVETTAPTSPAVATELADPFGNLDVPVVSKPLADPLEDFELTEGERYILSKIEEKSRGLSEPYSFFSSGYVAEDEFGDNKDATIKKFIKLGLIEKIENNHYYYNKNNPFLGEGFYFTDRSYYVLNKDLSKKEIIDINPVGEPEQFILSIRNFKEDLGKCKTSIEYIILKNIFHLNGLRIEREYTVKVLNYLKENKEKYGLRVADRDIGNLRKGDLCSKSYYDSLVAETSGADAVDQKKGVGGFLETQGGINGSSNELVTPSNKDLNENDITRLGEMNTHYKIQELITGEVKRYFNTLLQTKTDYFVLREDFENIEPEVFRKKLYGEIEQKIQRGESSLGRNILDGDFLNMPADMKTILEEKFIVDVLSIINTVPYDANAAAAGRANPRQLVCNRVIMKDFNDWYLSRHNPAVTETSAPKSSDVGESAPVAGKDHVEEHLSDTDTIKNYSGRDVNNDVKYLFENLNFQDYLTLADICKKLNEFQDTALHILDDGHRDDKNYDARREWDSVTSPEYIYARDVYKKAKKLKEDREMDASGPSASGAGASESAPVAGAVGGNTPENLVGTEDVINLDKLVEDLEKRTLEDFEKGDLEQIQLQQYLRFKRRDPLLGRKSSLDEGIDPVFEKMKEKGMLFKDNSNLIAYWNSKKGKICYCSIGSEMLKSVREKILHIKEDLPKIEDVVNVAVKKIGGKGWLDIDFMLESIFESLNRDKDISLFANAKYFIDIQESLMKKNIALKADFDSDKFGIKSGRVYRKEYLDNIKKKIKEGDKDEGKEKPKEDKPDSAVESDPLAKELDKAREKYAKLRAEYDYVNASHIRKYLELREWVKGKARSTKKFENSQRFAPVDLPEKAKSSELMEAENAYKKALLEYRKNILEKQKTTDGVLKKSEFEVRKGKLVDITDEDEAKTAGKSKKENVEKVSINMALLDDAVLESEKLFALRMKNKPPIFGERIARLRSFLAEHKYKRILLTGTIIGMGTLVAGATPMMALGAGAVRVARGLGTIGVASGAGAITAKFLDSRRKNDSKLNFGEALSGKEEIDDDLMTTLNEISEKQMEKMKKDRKWATRAAFLAGGAFALGSTLYTSPAYASEVNTRTGAEDTNSVPRNVVGVKLADTRPWYKFWDKGEPRPIQQQDNSSADSTLNQRPTSTGTTGAVDQASKGPTGPTGQTGTSGAGALNQQPPKVETPVPDISTAPLKTEFSSLGSIQTLKDLKANIGQIPDDGKYVAIKNFLSGKTPEQLSKDLGLWKPNGQSGESAMFRQGDSLYIDSKGQLVVNKGGVGTVLFDNKGQIHKYGGEMFHAQMPKASVRLEPTRPFVEPKPKVGQEYLGDDSVGRVYYYDDKGVKHYNDEFMIDNEIPSDKVTPLSDSIEGHPNDYIIKDNTSTPSSEIIKENIDSIKPPSGFDQPVDENGNGFIRYNGDKVVAILDGNKNEISTIKNGHIELKDNLQFGSSSEQLASRLQYNTAISKLRSEGKISPIVTDIPYKPFKNSQFSVEEVVRGQEKTFDVLLNGKKITSFEGTDGVDGKGKLVLEFNKELPRRNGWFIFSHKSDWYKAFEYFRDQAVSYTKDGVKIGNKTFRVASGK